MEVIALQRRVVRWGPPEKAGSRAHSRKKLTPEGRDYLLFQCVAENIVSRQTLSREYVDGTQKVTKNRRHRRVVKQSSRCEAVLQQNDVQRS